VVVLVDIALDQSVSAARDGSAQGDAGLEL
jgi:hypothetical protein